MDFYTEWFSRPELWFNSNFDNYIISKYECLLNLSFTNKEAVLIYDQLPRHVFRSTCGNHIIEYYLQKALNELENVDMTNLNDNEWCFMMLPYRHTKNLDVILDVMHIMWLKYNNCKNIKSFLRATYERCPTDNQITQLRVFTPKHINLNEILDKYKYLLDNTYKCNEFHDFIETSKCSDILWSISGGVDSMTCGNLYLNNIKAAIYINYANRDVADDEEAFIIDWCSYLGVKLYIRKISEINRQTCMDNDMRDVYESYTRNVRYGVYKTVKNMYSDKLSVMMGHNKDDCMENIFTNISNKNHYDNLKGMEKYSIQDNISFFRPLINKTKEQIRKFAYNMNIPHLPNSTPTWSMRGKIRNNIVPVCNNWNPSFIPGLFYLSETIENMNKIYDKYINNLFIKYNLNNELDISELSNDKIFWKKIIYKITNQIISDKSIHNLIDRFKTKKNMTVMLSKKVTLKIINDKMKINIF
jgi:tRNA(Ile)-lysidine synthetase-like protein